MSSKKYYTIEQLDSAKKMLKELPDLRKNRLTKEDMLEKLKEQIIMLASNKGYTAYDIKSVLDTVGVVIGVKSIQEIISVKKLAKNKSVPKNNPV